MRILVTGGAGFIGSHLVDRLVSEHRVTCLDRNPLGTWGGQDRWNIDCREVTCNRTIPKTYNTWDFVYHLASTVGVSKVLNDPSGCIKNIVESTKAVLSLGVPGIYFSTSEVYGQNTDLLREDSPVILSSKARWSYACAKLCGEWMALQAGWKVVRLFNVIGPRQSHESGAVVPNFVRQALAGEPITVYGNGSQVRTFIDVLDCVEILDRLRDKDFDVVNIGGPSSCDVYWLAREVRDTLDSTSHIREVPYSQAYPQGFEECPRRIPDLTRLHSLIPDFKYRDFRQTILSVAKELQCTPISSPSRHPANQPSSQTPQPMGA